MKILPDESAEAAQHAKDDASTKIRAKPTTDDWRDKVDLTKITDPSLKEEFFGMLCKHHKAWDGSLGEFRATSHRVDTVPGSRPILQLPYRSLTNRDEIAEHYKMQLDAGIIDPETS